MPYYRGQGKILRAERDVNGQPKSFRYFGKTAKLKVEAKINVITRLESETGQANLALRLPISKEATVSFEIEEWNAENLGFLWSGTPQTVTGATVTGEALSSVLCRTSATTCAPPGRLSRPWW